MGDIVKEGVQPIINFLKGKIPEVPRIEKIERCGLTYPDKVTLITGGSKGIGKGCAEVFVDAGAKVMICDIDVELGKKVAAELNNKGPGECKFEECDISKSEQFKILIQNTVKEYGKLDCLINNAAYHGPHSQIDDCTPDDMAKIMQNNFMSQFYGCLYALRHLRKTKGNIINMGSITGLFGEEGGSMYSATKGAIGAFTKSLSVEEARHGVRVNCVVPGNIYTESRRQGVASIGEKGPEVDRWADANQPIGRSGTPQEVAQACLFLASDAASFISGIDLLLTHGVELSVGIKYPSIRF